MFTTRLCVFVGVFVGLISFPTIGVAQETARTPWGDPDLQGLFDYATSTPMVRPAEYGDREFLTDEEAAELEQGAIDRDKFMTSQPVSRAEAGDAGGANSHAWQWGLDFGTQVVEDLRTSRIIDPPNGRFPELTADAQARSERLGGWGANLPASDHYDLGQGDRCLALHGLPLAPLPYNNLVHLMQTPDHFVIYAEAFRTWRIVPITDRAHGSIPQRLGDGRAHWDGDTLVVETTQISHRLQQGGMSIPRKITERFTRESDGVVRYAYTVDAPDHWTAPWTASFSLRTTDGPLFEVACHEGNYAIVNILSGLRTFDGTSREPTADPGTICWDCEEAISSRP